MLLGKVHLAAADWAPDYWATCRLGAGHLGTVSYLFLELWRKNNESGNSLNAVEREPVPTRVLNPNASEASYKQKQRSYRKTNLKKKVLAPDSPGPEISSAETAAPKRTRPFSDGQWKQNPVWRNFPPTQSPRTSLQLGFPSRFHLSA